MAARLGTQCSVCQHREAAGINLALARRVATTALSKRYGVSTDSLKRHRANHMPPQLRAQLLAGPDIEGVDLDKLRETESQSLLLHLVALRNRLFATLDVAENCADGNMLARIAAQLHRNFELVGKLLGDLAVGGTTVNNVLIAPQYLEMRIELVRALMPFPEARAAVAQVLHAIEDKSAAAVAADRRELAR